MKPRIGLMCWLVLGALSLWGCPIPDAYKEPYPGNPSGGESGSTGGSSGNGSSSYASSGSSSGEGGGNSGGIGGMGGAGGMGGTPVCPEPGTEGSCGTFNHCPNECPQLVMVATGTTDGMMATYQGDKGWSVVKTIAGMKSDDPPAFAIRSGKNDGVVVFRNMTTGFVNHLGYSSWSYMTGFDAVSDVDGGNALVFKAPAIAASADAAHAAFLDSDGGQYRYAQFDGAAWNPKSEVVSNPSASLGYCAPGLTMLGSNVIFLNPGKGDEALYSRSRGALVAGTWDTGYKFMGITQQVDDVTPAIAALSTGPELLVVFTEKIATKPLHYVTRSGGAWTSSGSMTGASSIEVTLMALPAGGAILAYREYKPTTMMPAKIFWNRFDGANWLPMPIAVSDTVLANSKPALAIGAGDAEAELLFTDDVGNARHARLYKGATNFTTPVAIMGASGLVGIAAATNL